jgi:hypothetical protein
MIFFIFCLPGFRYQESGFRIEKIPMPEAGSLTPALCSMQLPPAGLQAS